MSNKFITIAGSGGGGGSTPRAPTEGADTLESRAMVSLLDLIGEGEIGGLVNGAQSIFFNETSLQNSDGTYNFKGVTWDARAGTQLQTPIPGYDSVESPFSEGVQVKLLTPHVITINNPNVDQVRVIVTIPALASTDVSTGDVHGTSVEYKFSTSSDNGAFVDAIVAGTPVKVGSTVYEVDGSATVSMQPSDLYVGVEASCVGAAGSTVTFQPQRWDGAMFVNFGSVMTVGASAVYVEPAIQSPVVRLQFISSTLGGAIHGNTISTPGVYSSTVSGKTKSKYQRSYIINLPKPASLWKIKMTRVTADSTSLALSNDTYFDSYVEIVNAKLSYPNSALCSIRIDSAQFSQIPTRAYLVDGLIIRIPSNYDPVTRIYTGVWDGTFKLAVSNNPAWVMYDLLTSERYGLGRYIQQTQVDKAKLYQIGRYCDELVPDGFGGMEPRFIINTVMQTASEAYKLISDLSSVFRGMSFWNGGMVGFTQDAPTDPSMVFSPANVVDGNFEYTGSARKDRHSVALVTWNDPAENFKQKVEYIEDADLVAKYGVRKIDTVAFGCTSRGQAHRAGLWMLYTEKYESDMITFKVGIDASAVLPGDIVKIQDPVRAGKRLAGRLIAVTANSATLDAAVTLGATGAQISLRMPNGTFSDIVMLEGAGTFTTVTWVTPLATLPLLNSMWIIAELNLVPLLARVIGIAQDGTSKSTFTIMALEHNPSKYAAIENGLKLEPLKTSVINSSSVSQPQNFSVIETMYQVAPSVIGTKLHLSWTGDASSYLIRWRCLGKYATGWQVINETTASTDIENVRKGMHEFSIVAVNALGKQSATPVTLSHDVVGKTTAPGDVINFQVKRRITDLLLTWNAVVDTPILGYEVREGLSWDVGTVITTRFQGTTVTHDQSVAGIYHYHIRSIDTSENYSDNVTTFALTLLAPAAVAGFDCVQNADRIEFRWDANAESNIVGYELREGPAWSSSTFLTQVNATTNSTPANSRTGARTFWVKAIASPGIYSDVATFSTTMVAAASDRNAIYVDDEVTNGWLGSKYNVSTLATALTLNAGKTYGEYVWSVSLPQTYRARNTIRSGFDAVTLDGDTWASVAFNWSSVEAARAWTLAGDVSSVNLSYYISKWVGLDPAYVEGFGLNNSTLGEKSTVAAQAVGLTYATGRFLKGVTMNDFARLSWNVAVPNIFNTTFWAIPQSVAGNQVYWSGVTATGLQLMVGYDAANGWFYLEDTLGQKITVPRVIAANDRILIGIVQTAANRTLYVGKLGEVSANASLAFAPIGALTSIRLTQ